MVLVIVHRPSPLPLGAIRDGIGRILQRPGGEVEFNLAIKRRKQPAPERARVIRQPFRRRDGLEGQIRVSHDPPPSH